MRYLHVLLFFVLIIGAAAAEPYSPYAEPAPDGNTVPHVLAPDSENRDAQPRRETVNLQLPATDREQRQDERCMTVCSGWGQDCVTLNAGTDRATRKCVRACKSFAEECL